MRVMPIPPRSRRALRWYPFLVLLVLLFPIASTGCGAAEPSGESEGTGGEAASGAEGAFVADPEMSGGSGDEADAILNVRFGLHEGYERAVVDLGTGDETAETVPEWTLSSPAGDGLLRVNLPSVSTTEVPDGEPEGSLLDSFYVVRAPDEGMFVDFFAREAFTYRVTELSDPARLVVDFKPSDDALTVPLPARGGNTVLTRPRAGTHVSVPFVVSGYSRNFEASNTIILRDAEGEILARETVLGNDWSATWGYFETTLSPSTFDGRGTLQVGTQSARDGTFEGVEIPLGSG